MPNDKTESIVYVRKVNGEILNKAKIHRLLSGSYAIKTCVFNAPYEVNINFPRFDTEEKAQKWLESSGKWEIEVSNKGGDVHA